jgi:hypothetical protein
MGEKDGDDERYEDIIHVAYMAFWGHYWSLDYDMMIYIAEDTRLLSVLVF